MVKKGVPTKFFCTHCPFSCLTTITMKKHTHAKHPQKVAKHPPKVVKLVVEPKPIEKEPKRKKNDESPETSMNAPPKKKQIVPLEQTKTEEKTEGSSGVEDMEEETVIIPRKVLNTMQDKLKEQERENEEIAKRTSDAINQVEAMTKN